MREPGWATTWMLPDGRTVATSDYRAFIEHVVVPIGGRVEAATGRGRMHDHSSGPFAIITGILVLPVLVIYATPHCRIEFWYRGDRAFTAPSAALMARYNQMASAAAVLDRLRAAFALDLDKDSANFADNPLAYKPILIEPWLRYELVHVKDETGGGSWGDHSLTVELQGFVRSEGDFAGITRSKPLFGEEDPK